MEMSSNPSWIQISCDLLGSVSAIALEDWSLGNSKKEDTDGVNSGAELLALMIRSQEPACVAESFPLQTDFTIPVLKGVRVPFGKKHFGVGRALLTVLMCNGRC